MRERLVGRASEIGLTLRGRAQAQMAAEYLTRFPVARLLTSPQQRARETADILAADLNLPVESHPDFDELDFGGWTGLAFAELENVPEWKAFNSLRSLARAPGGESLREVQARVLRGLFELHSLSQTYIFVIVTHADVIRSAVAYFSGAPLDLFLRFAIDAASITMLQMSDTAVQILCVNRTP